jgi:aminoglycoside/choline kinase family phosphotransferase
MPRLVSDPAEIDADWLSEALREGGVLPTGRVTDVARKMIGTGKMGDNVRYTLTYENAPNAAPLSVVAKLPAAEPTARASSVARQSYLREVRFYQEIAPRIPMRTPHCFAALIDDAGSDYVILMEDLSPAMPGDQTDVCTLEQAELAIREAAKLHGPLMNDASLLTSEAITQSDPAGSALAKQLLVQLAPAFVERFRDRITREGEALLERFCQGFPEYAASYAGPRTAVHADYRSENMLFGSDAGGYPIAIVDWQSPLYGCPLTDVAYFLGNGPSVDARRAHERHLVETYRKELSAFGAELAADECWQLYRRSSLHGILITILGCMTSGQEARSDRMFANMIERHLQHALDLEAHEFLS